MLTKRITWANKKILEDFFMSFVYSKTVWDLKCYVKAHRILCFSPKRILAILTTWFLFIIEYNSNQFFTIPLIPYVAILEAIFSGRQYQMFLRNPKAHCRHSFLYQVHLQLLNIDQILPVWLICFFWKAIWLMFINYIIFIKEFCKPN